jgi:hypothetical protein
MAIIAMGSKSKNRIFLKPTSIIKIHQKFFSAGVFQIYHMKSTYEMSESTGEYMKEARAINKSGENVGMLRLIIESIDRASVK